MSHGSNQEKRSEVTKINVFTVTRQRSSEGDQCTKSGDPKIILGKRVMRAFAGVPIGRSLACRPPAAAGMAACPGDNLRLPPAFRFHLQASFDERMRTPHSHKTPPAGVQSQGTQVGSHAQTSNSRKQDFPGVKELQLNPGGYNI